MAEKPKSVNSVLYTCEECGAEIVITTLWKPAFRDISPDCPYCHFPLTKGDDLEIMAMLKAHLANVQERIEEEVAA